MPWDIHHELPLDSVEALARRVLNRLPGSRSRTRPRARPRCGSTTGEPVQVEGRRRYGHFRSWRLATAEGPIEVGGWRIDAALAGRPSGEPVPGVEIPAASARLLGGGEAVRHLRVERVP